MAMTVRPTYGYDGLYLNFNGDTAANYTQHSLTGNGGGGTPGSGGGSGYSNVYMDFVLGTTVSSYPGVCIIDILDYANTNKYKTVRALGGADLNGTIAATPGRINFVSSAWLNTSAINSLVFTTVNNNFATYSSLALYGVK
jgi:hypothetical protein